MSFLKKLFGSKDEPIKSNEDFWNWFSANEKSFHEVVKSNKDVERLFFDKLSSKLEELKDGFFYLTGMEDQNTVELIFTADGKIENIVFVEELVAASPNLKGWKFTALKPGFQSDDFGLKMGGYIFDVDNINFYSNEIGNYPDIISITIVHRDLTEKNKDIIEDGMHIFLENYIGELEMASIIDEYEVIGEKDAEKDLVPISKLKDFLTWRQKEFIEKYEGVRHNTHDDEHAIIEFENEDGNKILAVFNQQLLKWDSKASHPWIGLLSFDYDGEGQGGMPGNEDYEALGNIEDEVMAVLADKDGYLNLGRETGGNERTIFFAFKDFRKPSKVFYQIKRKYHKKFNNASVIIKDKYWQSVDYFNTEP